MLENGETKGKKKIVISINPSKNKNPHKMEQSQPQDELSKLVEISQRCKDYFIKFLDEKEQEINYTEQMFSELHEFLQKTFAGLMEMIESKKRQIENSINDKRQQFLQIKQEQLNCLNDLILRIEEEDEAFKKNDERSEDKISSFAKLLNHFYEQIQSIEKVNYRQNIKDTIQFLHNIIEDQSSALSHDKIFEPSIPNVSISFNNEQLFSVKEDPWEQFKGATEKRQENLDKKISLYQSEIKV